MIEGAIETELEQNPDIANEFENIEDFKKYIFEKQFQNFKQEQEQQEGDDNSIQPNSELNRSFYQEGNSENNIENNSEHLNESNYDDLMDLASLDKENMKPNGFSLNLKKMDKNEDYHDEFMAN